MKRQRKTPWLALVSLILFAGVLPLGCGGGGGGNIVLPGLAVTFTPVTATPGNMTLNMGAAQVSGTNFSVPINVTGINDFFGAAFHVEYDPSTADFVGYSATGSVIDTGGGVVVLISAVDGAAGEVLVNATRQQGAGGAYVQGVDIPATSLLITLNFRALQATGGGGNTFAFSNREVQTCNDGTQTCAALPGVTWSGGTMFAN